MASSIDVPQRTGKRPLAVARATILPAVDSEGEVLDVLVQSRRNKRAALKLMRRLLKKFGFVQTSSSQMIKDLMGLQPGILGSQNAMNAVDGATIERGIRINQPDDENASCKVSRAPDQRRVSSPFMRQPTTPSTCNAISPQQEATAIFARWR
jgi:DDE domain